MKYPLILVCLLIGFVVKGQSEATGDSLDIMIGQMIMIGIGDFNDPSDNQYIFKEIKDGKVGGVVIYEKNISSQKPRKTLIDLILKLQKQAQIPLFVSIDEEGGRVTRLKAKYGFPPSVTASYLGRIDQLDSTQFYATQTSSLLSQLGINMNYAPVLDVNINPENPVIGKLGRSYSKEYKQVINHSSEIVSIHNQYGVVPVVKHFPGHGSSQSDTHLGLTDVTKSWQFEELYPYKALIDSGSVGAIMTAHIVNEVLDRSKVPATLSRTVVTGLLREFLDYDGVVISDDMQMGAIKNEYGIKEAIRMAINAGVDILMFANNVEDYDLVTASDIHYIIRELIQEESITQDQIKSSYDRIIILKSKIGLLEAGYYKSLKNSLKSQ